MKVVKRSFRVIIEILALLVFVALLAAIFQNFVPGGPGASVYPPPVALATETSGSAYPPPEATAYPYPVPSSPPLVYASPTPYGLYPSWTPYPTNTARPGPTFTPIPLVQPAKDAAGVIYYVVKDEKGEKALKAFEVDDKAKVKTEAKKIAGQLPEGTYYPSPDGKQTVIIVGTEGSVGYVLDNKSGKISPLLETLILDAFYNWYPDSKHVLVNLALALWLVDIHNEDKRTPLLIPGLGAVTGASSSPDGRKIIYADWRRDGSSEMAHIGIMDADGRNAIEIMQTPHGSGNFTWSPDGTQIAFFGNGLMVMNADGSNSRQLGHLPLPHCYDIKPLWSPDSRKLALPVISERPGAFCQGWSMANFDDTNIAVFDVESGQYHILPARPGTGNIDPSWSPDGKKLIFVSNRSGQPNLWIVDADGTNPEQLTTDGQFVRFPAWRKP